MLTVIVNVLSIGFYCTAKVNITTVQLTECFLQVVKVRASILTDPLVAAAPVSGGTLRQNTQLIADQKIHKEVIVARQLAQIHSFGKTTVSVMLVSIL